MFDFDLGVIAEHRFQTNYEVFCNRCEVSIGVMSFQVIKEATFATYQRGGILCPDCRKATCDVCAAIAADFGHSKVCGPKGWVRVCPACEASIYELNRVADYQIAGPGRDEVELDEIAF